MTTMSGRVLGVVCAMSLWGGVAQAEIEKSVHASFSEGLSIETSGVHRVEGGGVITFGRVAVDANLGVDVWTRWLDHKGTRARGVDLGANVRVDILGRGKLRGPYLFAGASYVRFFDGAEKKLSELTMNTQSMGPNGMMARLGVGYGFPTTKTITIAVKIEVSYWRYEIDPFPPEAPDPHPNPLVFHIGLEFMRWM